MVYKSKPVKKLKTKLEITLRLHLLRSPEIAKGIDRLYARYGKHAVPVTELRKRLDKEMGEKTLTEELYVMREGR